MPDQPPLSQGRHVYARLLRYARPHWPVFVYAMTGILIYAPTDAAFAALMKPMLDGSFVERDPQVIRLMPLAIIGLFLLRGLSGFVSSYALTWIGRRVIESLRNEMFEQLLRLPGRFFDNQPSGQIVSRMTFNTEQVANATTNAVMVLVRDSLTIVFLLAWMLYLNAMLSLVLFVLAPLIALLVKYLTRRFRRISRRIQDGMGVVTSLTGEAIKGQREIRIYDGQAMERERFRRVNRDNRQQHMKMAIGSAVNVQVVQILAACALAAIVWLASSEEMRAVVTVGTFMSFILAMLMLLPPIKRLTNLNALLQKSIAAAQNLFEFLDAEAEQDTGSRRLERARGRVEYRHVGFAYDLDKGQVLQDVSFLAEPGQTVAFVGRSGSGKTTLVNLLPRFYEPNNGQILLDGLDVRELELASLRRQIALVSQQVTLFNDTVANNIAYGSLNGAGQADIERAAEAAHALDFIRRLPQGFDTPVGENGVLLSGGQRQRIAIARAILKNAPILILDEATSALDTEAEQHIQAALENLMQHSTTLVIAHRLSTIEQADCILVMDQGRIIERGTHAQLLAQGGVYAGLHARQFRDGAD